MYWYQFSPGIWFWMIINWLVPIGLIVLGIVGVVFFLRARDRASDSRPVGDSALRILRERYARGEISEEEYERMKRRLVEH